MPTHFNQYVSMLKKRLECLQKPHFNLPSDKTSVWTNLIFNLFMGAPVLLPVFWTWKDFPTCWTNF